jgi:hypothetical protein
MSDSLRREEEAIKPVHAHDHLRRKLDAHDVGPSDSRAPRINPHDFLRRVMEAYAAGPWSSENEKQKFLEDATIVFERVVMGWEHKPEGLGGA